MKRVYLQPAGKMHSAFSEMMKNPPEGYTFITQDGFIEKTLLDILYNSFVFHHLAEKIATSLPLHIIKSYLGKFKKIPKNIDLTYACGHFVLRKEPWVVELEWVTQLAGFSAKYLEKYKGLIETVLSSDYCKRIICMTELTKKTILQNLSATEFGHKLETVYRTVRKKDFTKDYNDNEKVRLIFVGSANIPEEFDDEKGGKELLEVIALLNRKYNNLEFVVRSDVPPNVKEKCRQISNLKLIDYILSWAELEQEFESADIALLPAHHTPSLAFLDAMSYEMPVVTIDSWANAEIVEDGKTGIVVSFPKELQLPVGDFLPSGKAIPLKKGARIVNQNVVRDLATKTGVLIENEELRRTIGKAARYEVEYGRFSMERRKEKLKQIFDEATA